jgi:hypothetical protein
MTAGGAQQWDILLIASSLMSPFVFFSAMNSASQIPKRRASPIVHFFRSANPVPTSTSNDPVAVSHLAIRRTSQVRHGNSGLRCLIHWDLGENRVSVVKDFGCCPSILVGQPQPTVDQTSPRMRHRLYHAILSQQLSNHGPSLFRADNS